MERKRKTLQELLFKDNFMFCAVMMDEDIAKAVLERILSIKIEHVEISREKNILYNPDYKGVRLDIYLMDENNTHFDIEMQTTLTPIEKRSRYYHSQIDMELLETGVDYQKLPDTFVIFICDYDPIGLGKYKYTIRKTLFEENSYDYYDGSNTIFLNTKGTNNSEVSKSLINFLKFVGAENDSEVDAIDDDLVSQLQKSIEKIKENREWGKRYMTFEEIKKEEYNAGLEEGISIGEKRGEIMSSHNTILLLLGNISKDIPVTLEYRITSIDNADDLSALILVSAKANSINDFDAELTKMGY